MNHTLVRLAALGLFGIFPVACRSSDSLAPQCAAPAPLLGQPDPAAPGFIVVFHDQVDALAETEGLAFLYGFTPTHVYTAGLKGFSAQLNSTQVAHLRCEPSVANIEYDSAVSGAA